MMRNLIILLAGWLMLCSCGARGGEGSTCQDVVDRAAQGADSGKRVLGFDADSAYHYVEAQVKFGPRVPNTEAHRLTGEWLASELKRHGAEVTLQRADLAAWDGTLLHAVNIMGSFNPEASERLLLLAHYDTRPWADQDPDPQAHKLPVMGANDGASGVGILLETARQLGQRPGAKGIDILFVDAEDYGTDGREDSWALGARHFATHPIREGYSPGQAVLLDMVGDRDAVFPAEYFSRRDAAWLDDAFRSAAARAGHASRFPANYGSAVTDDHVQLLEAGIPAIDIIDYRQGQGFCPTWHTTDDTMDHIDRGTLRAVGESLMQFIADWQ